MTVHPADQTDALGSPTSSKHVATRLCLYSHLHLYMHKLSAQHFDEEVLDPLIVLVMRTTSREGM